MIGKSTGAISISARVVPDNSRRVIGKENTESFEPAVYNDHRPTLLCNVLNENTESESLILLYGRELDKLDSNSWLTTSPEDVAALVDVSPVWISVERESTSPLPE